MTKKTNTIDQQWGALGLTNTYLVVPEVLLLRYRDLGLTIADVMFVQQVVLCQNRRTVPYAVHLGLNKETVTAVKKRLVRLGHLKDLSTRDPRNPIRVTPRYDLTGLFQALAKLTQVEGAAQPPPALNAVASPADPMEFDKTTAMPLSPAAQQHLDTYRQLCAAQGGKAPDNVTAGLNLSFVGSAVAEEIRRYLEATGELQAGVYVGQS